MISYDTAQRSMDNAINDLRILSADIIGPSDAALSDVEGTAIVNLKTLIRYIEEPQPAKVYPEVRIDR